MEEPSNRAAHRVARHYGLRTVRYKLIYYYDLGEWEFFDLKDDPREMTNLYESPSQQSKRSIPSRWDLDEVGTVCAGAMVRRLSSSGRLWLPPSLRA